MNPYGIAIHGGAGTISKAKMNKWKTQAYYEALKHAYSLGYQVLRRGGKATDAVIEAVIVLEDSHLFNAGKGSVFTHEGKNEMDAAIMDGKKLRAGGVAAVQFVKNPVKLAEIIMHKSRHVLLSGDQALEYAKKHELQIKDAEYFYDEFRYKQLQRALTSDKTTLDHDEGADRKFGTVGAVALDKRGNLAAATSTGGMTNKKYGRIGDSPLIGLGTYANNETCAISCTGHGEYYMRGVVAYDVSARMEYLGETLQEATNYVIHEKLVKLGGRGGLIGIDQTGKVVLPFNTKGMYRGVKLSDGTELASIF
ncbi:isoaspartyl peptidase/L-asparaginase family protein [Reichenbachiella versicolor]|uniref:isoaspartyl peptidase/L-asparaginase family protein n=1 Tax=Reichenbachiella versicolor TaxID=1821036 RepID=UPI000D6E3838|nr:isoaspartyl peptidase/L-asparaginase [Reichenbachiella versicolor]